MDKIEIDTLQKFMETFAAQYKEIFDAGLGAELHISVLIPKDTHDVQAMKAVISLIVDGDTEYSVAAEMDYMALINLTDLALDMAGKRAPLTAWSVQQIRRAVSEFSDTVDYSQDFEAQIPFMHPKSMYLGIMGSLTMVMTRDNQSSVEFTTGVQVHADTEEEDRAECKKLDIPFVPKVVSDFCEPLATVRVAGLQQI